MIILVVGAGRIAEEYVRVLLGLGLKPVVVTKGLENAIKLSRLYESIDVFSGGIEKYLCENPSPDYAIVATPIRTLFEITRLLITTGCQNILVEKPGVFSEEKAIELCELSIKHNTNLYIAFNRRAYQSVQIAKQLIESDGGVTSVHFDFSEAIYRQSENDILSYDVQALKYWGIGNSAHVIDTVFYLCGTPKWLKSERYGDDIKWHPNGSIFYGIGQSTSGAPITYHSNWVCPGKWRIEIMTKNRKLILSPMEKLRQQSLQSFIISEVEIKNDLDTLYKPGFYLQVKEFLNDNGYFRINELPNRLKLLNEIFDY